jgi:glutathione reductase (NADPH)
MRANDYDFLVIGGGSGGIAAAKRAAGHGGTAAVIERDRLGGTCANRGCVPKKIMFNAAAIAEVLRDARDYGFNVGEQSFSWSTLKRARDGFVEWLIEVYRRGLLAEGVTDISGDARFVDAHTVEVNGGDPLRAARQPRRDHALPTASGRRD